MTTAATLIQRTRRFLQDWPEGDSLTASCTANSTTLTVADATIYTPGHLMQIGTEGMQVRSGVSTTLTVLRGARGTTATTHANGDTILIRPRFLDSQYLDALNSGISATFPWIYQPVTDDTTVADSTTYEYTIPNLNGAPMPYISRLSFKETGDLTFREFRGWRVVMGTAPVVKLKRPLTSGLIRFEGYGPIDLLADLSASLTSQFPVYAEDALVMFAAQWLLAASEAARVREDTGARDQRDNANRVGGAISASNQIYNRFQRRIMDSGMPPMPKHVVSVV